MPTPPLVPTPVDAIEKISGRDFIALLSRVQFSDPADKAAFRTHLGITGAEVVLTPQGIGAGETVSIPDGRDLIVAPGFAVLGSLEISGTGRLYVV